MWAHSFFLTSIGYSLGLLQKYFDMNTSISSSEWTALGIGVGFSIILYLIGFLLPHKRKKLLKISRNILKMNQNNNYLWRPNNDYS